MITCESRPPSAAVELGWLLDLLVQSARYAEPALDELERSLAPGIAGLRATVRQRYRLLWNDRLTGCPELLVAAAQGGFLADDDPRPFLAWLSSLPAKRQWRGELLSEPPAERRLVRRRVAALSTDVKVRRGYRDLLTEVWEAVRPGWARRGRLIAGKASTQWGTRLEDVTTTQSLLQHMPPRHPLARINHVSADLLTRRRRFELAPAYFCMSGGLVADLDDRVLVVVPASDLEPIRTTRDASFVASRSRVLSEPTRVRILIELMKGPSGVMHLARTLDMSQPTVSEHVRALTRAGAVHTVRLAGRNAYTAPWAKTQRLIEDMRATLARWA